MSVLPSSGSLIGSSAEIAGSTSRVTIRAASGALVGSGAGISGAPDTIFTLAAAKEHLRVTWSSEDALISALLDAAVGVCEQYTRRAFTERIIKQYVSADRAIADAEFYSPLWPVKSAAVKYGAGPTTLASVIRSEVGHSIVRVAAWGGIGSEGDVAWIEWTVGPDGDIPKDIVAAVHLVLGDLYANREASIVGTIISPNPALRAILQPYIVDMTV